MEQINGANNNSKPHQGLYAILLNQQKSKAEF